MRSDKTLNVIANHKLQPGMKLTPLAESDRSWAWPAADFDEGKRQVLCFALKFAKTQDANDFKDKFVEGQQKMKKCNGEPDADGSAAANEAAETLEKLSTGDQEEEV